MNEGSTIGPYVVRRHLGEGGMGSVWLADDTRLNRRVALKTLRAARGADTAGRERLLREARAVAALNHPHIAAVYDVLEVDGDVAIVLEYVEGETLASALANGPWPIERVIETALQLSKALRSAHAQGVVHRDLKPSNVIVGTDGVKVLDFGIARLLPVGTTMTVGGETTSGPGFMGTPAYAAPEQLLSSAVDERADLYALGVILFEMVSGARPFPGHDAVALAKDKLGREAPRLSAAGARVPAAFETLVAALLERDPASRPASASEVVRALQAITGETPTSTTLPAPRQRVAWYAAAIVGLAAVIAVLVAGLPLSTRVATSGSSTPVVAVLPLRNTSGDPSQDFIASGLAESLIADLASSPSLTVLSRSAIADALNGGTDSTKATKSLGANVVVDGSVQRSGEQLRVNISVIRGDRTVWGGTFDGTTARVFELQTRMALGVRQALSAGAPSQQSEGATGNRAALEAYWRGRAFLDRRDVRGNIDAAIAALNESVSEDSNFALAHAGLGIAYWQKYVETREQQFARQAVDEGTKAAALDPALPEVRFALSVSLNGTGRRDEAIGQLREALKLRPTFDDARRQLGSLLAAKGEIDNALTEFRAAIALRPKFWGGFNDMGLALLRAARYDEALQAFEQAVALQPDNHIGYQQIGVIHQTRGDLPRAIEAYERSLAIRPSFGVYSNLGMMQHMSGHYPQAIEAYKQAIQLRPNLASLYRNLGDAYQKMGDPDQARIEYITAIEKTNADLVINPKSGRSLAALAVYLAKAGRQAEATLEIGKALQLAADDVEVMFRAAVTYSLVGRPTDAMKYVANALRLGYSPRAIQEEEDFASLRTRSDFQQLTRKGEATDGQSLRPQD